MPYGAFQANLADNPLTRALRTPAVLPSNPPPVNAIANGMNIQSMLNPMVEAHARAMEDALNLPGSESAHFGSADETLQPFQAAASEDMKTAVGDVTAEAPSTWRKIWTAPFAAGAALIPDSVQTRTERLVGDAAPVGFNAGMIQKAYQSNSDLTHAISDMAMLHSGDPGAAVITPQAQQADAAKQAAFDAMFQKWSAQDAAQKQQWQADMAKRFPGPQVSIGPSWQ